MSNINRKEARKALAAHLATLVTKAEEVFDHQASDFGGASPVVYVTSSKSSRRLTSLREKEGTFGFNVHTFVLYPGKVDPDYTESDAEDMLDDIECQIADACDSSLDDPIIQGISCSEPSNADDTAKIAGETYLHEIIPVTITCF